MLCWEEGRSERFVAFPPLPPRPSVHFPLTHEHPAPQMVTLTHSCCKFPWLRPCYTHPGVDSGSRHVHLPRLRQSLRTTHRGRPSWPPRPTPPDSRSCLLSRWRERKGPCGVSPIPPSFSLLSTVGGRHHLHATSKRQDTETLKCQASFAQQYWGEGPH